MGKGLSQLYQELVRVDDGLDNERVPLKIQRKSGKFASSGKQGEKAEKAKAMNKANAEIDIDALMENEPRAEDDSEAERERASLPLAAFAIY
jgi:hypothetical protein